MPNKKIYTRVPHVDEDPLEVFDVGPEALPDIKAYLADLKQASQRIEEMVDRLAPRDFARGSASRGADEQSSSDDELLFDHAASDLGRDTQLLLVLDKGVLLLRLRSSFPSKAESGLSLERVRACLEIEAAYEKERSEGKSWKLAKYEVAQKFGVTEKHVVDAVTDARKILNCPVRRGRRSKS